MATPKFIEVFDQRMKVTNYIAVTSITSVCEDNGFGGKAKIEFFGDSGYQTKAVYVEQDAAGVILAILAVGGEVYTL